MHEPLVELVEGIIQQPWHGRRQIVEFILQEPRNIDFEDFRILPDRDPTLLAES